jgi:hypothetical protein
MPLLTVKSQALEDVFEDMARVHLSNRPGTHAGDVIVIEANGKKLRAIARGAPGNNRRTIHLDLAARERLGVNLNDDVEFKIRRGRWWHEVAWAWHATNAMPRIAIRLAVLSVILGAGGLVLGLISLAK